MWAIVLVPMWMRGSHNTNPGRSVNRFHRAMDTLQVNADAAETVIDVREHAPDPEVVRREARRRRRAREQAAARRRRTLLALSALLLVTLVVVVVAQLSLLLLVVPVGLIAGFLVLARRSVIAQAASERYLRVGSTRVFVPEVVPQANTAPPKVVVHRGHRVMDPAPRSVVNDGPKTLERWDPVPTTLPTYVTAPAATRVPRMIDLTTPGAWSGQAMVEQAMRSEFGASVVGGAAASVPAQDTATPEVVAEPPARRTPPTTFAERFVADEVDEIDMGDESFWQRTSTG